MTRLEKALKDSENRQVNGDIKTMYSDGTWHSCCPAFIGCGIDDLDEDTRVGKYGSIKGCRGITCARCWSRKAD